MSVGRVTSSELEEKAEEIELPESKAFTPNHGATPLTPRHLNIN